MIWQHEIEKLATQDGIDVKTTPNVVFLGNKRTGFVACSLNGIEDLRGKSNAKAIEQLIKSRYENAKRNLEKNAQA